MPSLCSGATIIESSPVAELLPHGPEALCLGALLEYVAGERIVARLRVRQGLALYDAALAGIPAWAGIEIMAQTAGMYVGLEGRAIGDGPRVGYLVGVRRFYALRPLFAEGLELVSEARAHYCAPTGLSRFTCRIACGTQSLASATLAVWRPSTDDVMATNNGK